MCYHASAPERTELDDLFDHAVRTDEWDTYYHYLNGYSHKPLPVLKVEDPSTIHKSSWGLVASWAKDKEKADMLRKGCLNAKSEDIWETASYRNLIGKKRCLIFLNGFYEFRHVTKDDKIPYLIGLKNQKTFATGGVYDTWVDKVTGEVRNTCSIITTPANPLMAKIHNTKQRMPLMFTKENMYEWLNPKLTREDINALMQPLNEELMMAHPIMKFNPQKPELYNNPEFKNQVDYPQLALID
jgi:putative SOS response-associated peptidase YedK